VGAVAGIVGAGTVCAGASWTFIGAAGCGAAVVGATANFQSSYND
jgi:hypothetical protein